MPTPALEAAPFWRPALSACALALAGVFSAGAAHANEPAAEAPTAPPVNSNLDDRLLYQLLVGEMALNAGDAGSAYELVLDAARRTRDEGLFRRAVDIALQARAGEQALLATRAWRTATPKSADAVRLQVQILMLLDRPAAASEPLRQLLALTLPADLPDLIGALPRLMQRSTQPRVVAQTIEDALKPYRSGATAVGSRVTVGRAWLEAGDSERALQLAREALQLDPSASDPAVLAMAMMREQPAAEALVRQALARPAVPAALRLAYVRQLTSAQRYADAVAQLEQLVAQQPQLSAPHLSLGALQLELRQTAAARQSLTRYVTLARAEAQVAGAGPAPMPGPGGAVAATEPEDDDHEDGPRPDQGLQQAYLLLAQVEEQAGRYAEAETWLSQVSDPQRLQDVQLRRAAVLARQGRIDQARALIQRLPERREDDARGKLLAEAGLLREVKRWAEAYQVLARASARFQDDPDLLYEQAMVAEKLNRVDDMERLLRQVIALKPENAHAHNALGYSLADRQQRLPEARELIRRALTLAPGDPFITDSLGWVEFRLGNRDEALRLLRMAYAARPDPEIAAHLGEVLWVSGQADEARRVWREGRQREADNEVLRETLQRLKVQP